MSETEFLICLPTSVLCVAFISVTSSFLYSFREPKSLPSPLSLSIGNPLGSSRCIQNSLACPYFYHCQPVLAYVEHSSSLHLVSLFPPPTPHPDTVAPSPAGVLDLSNSGSPVPLARVPLVSHFSQLTGVLQGLTWPPQVHAATPLSSPSHLLSPLSQPPCGSLYHLFLPVK